MKCKIMKHSALLLLLLFAAACSGNRSSNVAEATGGDTVKMKYAEHINIIKYKDYTVVELDNPWKSGATLHRYVLVARKDSARMMSAHGKLPQGTIVYTPLRRTVVFTSPHCYLLSELQSAYAIRGVCDVQYINLPKLRNAVRDGKIVDCGNSMSPTVERIIQLGADAVFVSPFDGVSYGQLETMHLPIIECADYMETSALGRAEWMRFYGMLVGKESQADSLFNVVETAYNRLSTMARRDKIHPKVLTERVVSGVWYCPGGRSSMGRLLADAGARYVFADDKRSGSLTLSPEVVLTKASDADYWMFVAGNGRIETNQSLISEYAGYATIKAFRDGNVLQCLPGMDNPYFEEVSFRPDYLMQNLVALLHPNLRIECTHYYYSKKELK